MLFNMKTMKKIMPGRKKMSTGTKMMIAALPVVAFMAGKMMGAKMEDRDDEW